MNIDLSEEWDGGASFDQTKAELLEALRKETRGFFVVLQDGDAYAWHTMTDIDGCETFLRTVVANARAELADLARQLGVTD